MEGTASPFGLIRESKVIAHNVRDKGVHLYGVKTKGGGGIYVPPPLLALMLGASADLAVHKDDGYGPVDRYEDAGNWYEGNWAHLLPLMFFWDAMPTIVRDGVAKHFAADGRLEQEKDCPAARRLLLESLRHQSPAAAAAIEKHATDFMSAIDPPHSINPSEVSP